MAKPFTVTFLLTLWLSFLLFSRSVNYKINFSVEQLKITFSTTDVNTF